MDDGVELLSQLSGLEGNKMTVAKDIVTILKGIPLALSCAGHYMQSKAFKNPSYSSLDFLSEFKSELQIPKREAYKFHSVRLWSLSKH